MNAPTVKELVTTLDLLPHPEGGFYRETWRDPAEGRGSGTAIYFLLPGGVESRWHRIDAVEIWHHYAGAPLELLLSSNPPETDEIIRIGSDIIGGERPQGLVKPGQWQAARSLGAWTLVGCTVSPAFEFEHFEILGD